jgi:hypothetical protein
VTRFLPALKGRDSSLIPLSKGDAVRFTTTGGQRVTATEPAEILVWEMHATVTGW